MSPEADKAPYIAHLLVVCHGLWGTRAHIAYVCKSALEHSSVATSPRSRPRSGSIGSPDDDVRLVVLPASLNENTHTYDGVDVCAERVVKEIDDEIQRIAADGGTVKRFSIVGYSLGGLVARYVLGLLESRTPSFFAAGAVRPVNFTTFASPAIGIPRYDGFWSSVLSYLGARLLSRSGSQLYGSDRFLPSSLLDGNNQPTESKGPLARLSGKREKAEPLLAVMADPQYSFFRALAAFERVEIFANSVNDRTVPYPTGAIEAHDPFSLARAKAKKAAATRGDDPDIEPDIVDGGLEIKLDATGLLIESYQQVTPPEIEKSATPRKRFKISLPLLLRPTTYPFSRPVSLLIIVLLPVALPLALVFLVGRFVIAGHSSQRRIRQIRNGMGGGREGMLERVGVRLRGAIADVAETVQPDNPEHAGSLGSGGQGERDEVVPLRRHPAFAAFANSYGTSGTETPPLARPVSPGEYDPEATGSASKPFPTDPILSPAQVLMIHHLNSIPQMRKHLAYMPSVRNSHGAIVARDLAWPQHREGRKVVDAWAKEFVL